MRTTILICFIITMMAGCSDDSPTALTDGGPDVGVKATETTGVIRGVVVDESVRPVAGAVVTVPRQAGEPLVAETNAEGAFGFEGLEPGTYFIQVTKVGYFDTQQSTEVLAGVDEPPFVKILMLANPDAVPYSRVSEFTGFIECSTSVIAVCSVPNNGITGNVTNDRFDTIEESDPNPAFMQAELVWESTQSLFPNLYIALHASQDGDRGEQLGWIEGPSPQVLTFAGDELTPHSFGTVNDIMVQVFSAGFIDEGQFELTVNQEFQIFTTTTYQFQPPAGWMYHVNGEAVPPS